MPLMFCTYLSCLWILPRTIANEGSFIGINSTLAINNSVQITSYSPRFTLEDMTGTFQDQSPSVESINNAVAGSAKPSAVFNCGPSTCSKAKALAGLTLDGTTFPSFSSSTSKSTSRPTSTPTSARTQTPTPTTNPLHEPPVPSTGKGIIIGVTVGGVVLLLAILGGIWACCRSKKGKSGNSNGGKMQWYRAMTLNSLKKRANSFKVYPRGQATGPEGKGNYENLAELPAGFAGRGVDHRRRPVEVPEISGGLGLEDGENALGLLMTGARVPGGSDRSSFESVGVSEDEPGLVNRSRISELPAHADDGDFHRAIQESLEISSIPMSTIPTSPMPREALSPPLDELFMAGEEAKPELPKLPLTIGADPFVEVGDFHRAVQESLEMSSIPMSKLPTSPISRKALNPRPDELFMGGEEKKPELPKRPQ
jgi:hypothetical protein